ncbi:DUF2093 domain-containing protein [Sphingomonas canadensis]|uniref:DUF2093 domain-containing protein n=1 Tax=Sphingomonas canadensis TaxID=1219257 RepID=A0ABW3H3J5_9SPHN|nr:DUF2093 domain-containing protein [Sphingomonas canadensis]MCW3835575.1 DUF2093 domain-containing protein [Sphingomonas canadensis]
MLDSSGLAVLRYRTPQFDVLRRGSHVRCAVSGEPIPLEKLVYWSVTHQEAYRGAAEASAAILAGGASKLKR